MAKQTPAALPDSPEPAKERVPHYVTIENISVDAYHVKEQGKKAFIAEHRGNAMFDLSDGYDMILADLSAYEKAQKGK